jgi:hypothetical protein
MPWDITIVNAKDRRMPLGAREEVIARFAAALPGVVLQLAPGPSPEIVAQMPEVLREHFNRPRPLNAELITDEYSIHFFTDNQPEIDSIGAEVRGNGNPLPALAALCQPNGWAVVNDADGNEVELASASAEQWDQFRQWRDKAINSLKDRY